MGLFDRKTGRGSNTAKGKQGFQKATPKPLQAPNSYSSSPVKIPAGFTPPTGLDNRPTVDDMAARFRQAHPEYNTPVVPVPVPSGYDSYDEYDEMDELTYVCSNCKEGKGASEMATLRLCRSCANA